MARPTYGQWRVQSSATPGGTYSINPDTTRRRALQALAAFVLRTNPDGTTF